MKRKTTIGFLPFFLLCAALNLTAGAFPAASRGASEGIPMSFHQQIEDSPPLAARGFNPHSGTKQLKDILADLPFPMPALEEPRFPGFTVKITEFGAVADGRTLNTKAIADAIASCVKAGGGTVVLPPGTWLTGPIRLESNVNLRVEKGALVRFSGRISDFPFIAGFDGRSKRWIITPPLYAYRAENIAITGGGMFDGAGETWRYVKKIDMTERQWKSLVASGGVLTDDGEQWWPSREALDGMSILEQVRISKGTPSKEDFESTQEYLRPHMVHLEQCRGVLLDGPVFMNSPKFHIVPSHCENVIIRNINVFSPEYGQNTDGIDPRSCRNVVIYNCTVDVGDDGICLKPADLADGQEPGPSCRNIVVADCHVFKAHGGFVIGSESYGGVQNVLVRNCIFSGTDVGLRFKSARGKGGLVENVHFDGIQMRGIRTDAILFDMYYSGGAPEAEAAKDLTVRQAEAVTGLTPRFRDFHAKNIVVSGADRAVVINGLPEMKIRNMVLENVSVFSKRGVFIADGDSVELRDCTILPQSGPVFHVIQSTNVIVRCGFFQPEPGPFLRVTGEASGNIRLTGIDLKNLMKAFEFDAGAKAGAVLLE
jgi:polygalacturonase